MPTIKVDTAAASADLLAAEQFAEIPPPGAIVNMYVSCAANGGTFGFSIGDRVIVVPGTECNVEVAADVIEVPRDQVVFNEVVPGGRLFLPIGAAGTELQALIHIRYLR